MGSQPVYGKIAIKIVIDNDIDIKRIHNYLSFKAKEVQNIC